MVNPCQPPVEADACVQTSLSSGQMLTLCALIIPTVSLGVIFVSMDRKIIPNTCSSHAVNHRGFFGLSRQQNQSDICPHLLLSVLVDILDYGSFLALLFQMGASKEHNDM